MDDTSAVTAAEAPVIALSDVRKEYHMGSVTVSALRGVTFSIRRGEYAAIVGASGSGKSTLLHILGLLDRPSDGQYRYCGRTIGELRETELAAIRNQEIGFVFQSFNLLKTSTAYENVLLPLIYAPSALGKRRRVALALERVGMGHRLHHRPSELSGGEQQRVAIARALVKNPRLILADEPTGNLDSTTSAEIVALFDDLARQGLTIVIITHDPEVAECADRIITVRDGQVCSDTATTRAATRVRPDQAARSASHTP